MFADKQFFRILFSSKNSQFYVLKVGYSKSEGLAQEAVMENIGLKIGIISEKESTRKETG